MLLLVGMSVNTGVTVRIKLNGTESEISDASSYSDLPYCVLIHPNISGKGMNQFRICLAMD